jgi:hypothetical protein
MVIRDIERPPFFLGTVPTYSSAIKVAISPDNKFVFVAVAPSGFI